MIGLVLLHVIFSYSFFLAIVFSTVFYSITIQRYFFKKSAFGRSSIQSYTLQLEKLGFLYFVWHFHSSAHNIRDKERREALKLNRFIEKILNILKPEDTKRRINFACWFHPTLTYFIMLLWGRSFGCSLFSCQHFITQIIA